MSAAATRVRWRSFRFRLVDFLVKICEENALLRRILPLPVAVKRFAAPRLLFIFGIFILLVSLSVLTPSSYMFSSLALQT